MYNIVILELLRHFEGRQGSYSVNSLTYLENFNCSCDDHHNQFISHSKGLTLVELLVTMSLLFIIIFFTIPFTPDFLKKNELECVANEIKIAIHTAKMQALITRDRLALTPILGNNDWSQGMRLFVDNLTHQYTERDKLIYQWHWKYPGVSVTWQGFQSKKYILFSTDMSCSATNGYFMIQSTLRHIKLIINRLGRVKQE